MKVLFRTDGNHQLGMGDVWGALALATAFSNVTSNLLFLIRDYPEARDLIHQQGYALATLNPDTADNARELILIQRYGPDVIIVNKLNNPPGYLQALKHLTKLLVVLDDSGEGASLADININVLYHMKGAVTDPSYIALRGEFQRYHDQPRVIQDTVSRVLVTQGGSDTYGFTPKIVRALNRVAGDCVTTVVVGPAFCHFTELDQAMAESNRRFQVIHDAKNMGELMMAADLAITGGGNTMFELSCVGTPSIAVCGEEFEAETAERFARQGVVINLGFGERVPEAAIADAVQDLMRDAKRRAEMSRKGKALVDGRGATRVVELVLRELRSREEDR